MENYACLHNSSHQIIGTHCNFVQKTCFSLCPEIQKWKLKCVIWAWLEVGFRLIRGSWLTHACCWLVKRQKNVWHTHQYSWPVYLYFDVLFFLAKLDCSESPVFPYDHRDRRLCVTGCHLAWVSKLLSGQGGGLGGSEKNVFISILLAPSRKSYIIPDARPLRTFENQDGRH